MRFLAGEGLSIRDLKQILEAVLDYDYIVINDSEKMIIFDDRIATDEMPDHTWIDDPKNLTSYIRTRMKRFISHRFTQGSNNLVTFLLDPRLESFILKKAKDKRMLEENWLSMAHLEEIIHAFNEQLEIGVRSFTQQSILTTAEVRPYLYEILAPIFPRLQVLAYQELSPDINIQPIGRIEPEIDYKE
jgi:flagellar biosynthesis component FlhA